VTEWKRGVDKVQMSEKDAKDKRSIPHTRKGGPSIPKPISQAFYASLAVGGGSLVLGTPLEYTPRIALAGAVGSICLSWWDSRNETKPKKRNPRQVDFTSYRGHRKVDLEYSVSVGGTLIRETYLQAIWRKLLGNPRPVRVIDPAQKPKILSEFVFHSHYQGQHIELRKKHVKLFLDSAWRNRPNGIGLSIRHWERRGSQRPMWFKELPPLWFRGMSMLLYNAQSELGLQIVVTLDNQQSFLAVEPRELYCLLRWYEGTKNSNGNTKDIRQ
jgi:hypothetical protein